MEHYRAGTEMVIMETEEKERLELCLGNWGV